MTEVGNTNPCRERKSIRKGINEGKENFLFFLFLVDLIDSSLLKIIRARIQWVIVTDI